jgi:hypothetical protein
MPYYKIELRGAIPLRDKSEFWGIGSLTQQQYLLFHWRAIPVMPLWTGLVCDVVFWTIAPALLVFGYPAWRRLIRRRQGRCPNCGYTLLGAQGIVCPECGASD